MRKTTNAAAILFFCALLLTLAFALLTQSPDRVDAAPFSKPSFAPTPSQGITYTVSIPLLLEPFLIEDDFSDPNSGWEERDLGPFGTEYLNGQYRIVMASGNAVGWGTANHELTELEVAVDVLLDDGGIFFDGTGYGAIVVYDGLGGCHDFAAASDGRWYLFYLDDCGLYIGSQYSSSRYQLLADGAIPGFTQLTDPVRLKMIRQVGQATLFIDDIQVHMAPLTYSGPGRVLLKAQPLSGNSYGVDARFDNYFLAER